MKTENVTLKWETTSADNLPPINEDVLIVVDGREGWHAAFWTGDAWYISHTSDRLECPALRCVTHWLKVKLPA